LLNSGKACDHTYPEAKISLQNQRRNLMRLRRIACLALLIGIAAAPASPQSLPDPTRTPGAINPDVTEATLSTTACRRGWTQTVRPSAEFTAALKRFQLREWGYTDRRSRAYEEDHLIPLSLGGAPDDPRNLWPEPRDPSDGWGADRKDDLELVLNQLVCGGRLSLVEAQAAISANWIAAYRRFVNGAE
jgi:hypothetical protein